MVRATIRVSVMVLVNRDRNPSNANFYLKLLFITECSLLRLKKALSYFTSTTGLDYLVKFTSPSVTYLKLKAALTNAACTKIWRNKLGLLILSCG